MFDYLNDTDLLLCIRGLQNKLARITYGELQATKEDVQIDRRDLHDMSRELRRRRERDRTPEDYKAEKRFWFNQAMDRQYANR